VALQSLQGLETKKVATEEQQMHQRPIIDYKKS
jgi:hypothetical protein